MRARAIQSSVKIVNFSDESLMEQIRNASAERKFEYRVISEMITHFGIFGLSGWFRDEQNNGFFKRVLMQDSMGCHEKLEFRVWYFRTKVSYNFMKVE